MRTPNIENIDLVEILKQPTEYRYEHTETDFESIDENDFTKIEIPDIETHQGSNEPPTEVVEEYETNLSYEFQANLLITLLSSTGALLLKRRLKRNSFTPEELEQIKDYKQEKSEVTYIDNSLIDKYKDFESKAKDLELDEDEQAMIREPLIEVLKKYKRPVSPEMSLIIAVGFIYVGKFQITKG